jgi:DNA-binding MarR family transcriptional regulator
LVIDHVGVDLWRAAQAWKQRFCAEMVRSGHAWYGDARSAVVAHLDPEGLTQSELVRRMGMTKQAVQQLVDGLEADGIVRREADPEDGRSKRVVYTATGRAALRDAVTIKRRMERELRDRLGPPKLEMLIAILRETTDLFAPREE